MTRNKILAEIRQAMGDVPGWLSALPDPALEHQWGFVSWLLGDSALSARDKTLVALGASTAIHCPY